jgi:hypothetical protein
MARNKPFEERVKALVAELLAEEKETGQYKNIDDIEDGMVRIGDLVAREFGVRALAARTNEVTKDPRCPDCGLVACCISWPTGASTRR